MVGHKIALLFPGSGTYTERSEVVSKIGPAAKSAYRRALEHLDILTYARSFSPSFQRDLRCSEFDHINIFVTNYALFRLLMNRIPGLEFHATAGRGLGIYNASVASGAMSFEAALALVKKTGELIHRVARNSQSRLTFIVGSPGKDLTTYIRELNEMDLQVAFINTPNQLGVVGYEERMRPVIKGLYGEGIRILPTAIEASVNTHEMQGTMDELRRAMIYVQIGPARVPIVANTSGDLIESQRDIKQELLLEPYSPVDLVTAVRQMRGNGIELFVEIGTVPSFGGLVKQIDPSAEILKVKDRESLERTVASLSRGN